jgi:hypothetical protein
MYASKIFKISLPFYLFTNKSRVHKFTDAGPGVGVTNHDVQMRCAEIILLTEPDYYIRHHLANDDSSQNEVERCQSYVGDAICDGGSIPWEHKTPYEGISDEELASMTLEELEESEHAHMKYNAFKVCDELTCRIDGATAPGGFMKAFTSSDANELFFNNHNCLKAYLAMSDNAENPCPGRNYFDMLKKFKEQHIDLGEKYVEFVKCNCSNCQHCMIASWVGPPCGKVPKPYPDYDALGFHYMDVDATPDQIDGRARNVDDFQPRKQAKIAMMEQRLGTDEEIENFSKKYIVEKGKLKKYIDHLAVLDVGKTKRAEKRKEMLEMEKKKTFSDYDWQKLFDDGSLSKLKVCELDKYLRNYNIRSTHKLKKKGKVRLIQRHIARASDMQLNDDQEKDLDEYTEEEIENESQSHSQIDSSESSDDSGDDIVIADTHLSNSSSDESNELNDDNRPDDSFDVGGLFTVTRSGRTATTWKAAEYVSFRIRIYKLK